MAYYTMSDWKTTEWNDDLEKLARDKYVPLIMSMGAVAVRMVRTGEDTFTVLTEYADQAAADSAQARIAEVRSQAAEELPMSMISASAGAVFSQS